MRCTCLLILAALSLPQVTASGQSLVKDVGLLGGDSRPNTFVAVNGDLYFFASKGIYGAELWKVDPSGASASLVKDSAPGRQPGGYDGWDNYRPIGVVGSNLYWNGPGGLWKSDGSDTGTLLVGSDARMTLAETEFQGELFFFASDQEHGVELWKSDGSEAGTALVKDINQGPASSVLSSPLFVVGTQLLFFADDGSSGLELWRSDGSEEGTVMVKDINPGAASGMFFSRGARAVVFKSELIFAASDGIHGLELWKSDGTETGTVLLGDLVAGPSNGFTFNEGYFTAGSDVVYFLCCGGFSYIFKTDGTEGGTRLVAQMSVFDLKFPVVNERLYFDHGDGLWVSDGTQNGTEFVYPIYPRSSIVPLRGTADRVLFFAHDSTNGMEPWTTDGTSLGTRLIRDINPGSAGSAPVLTNDPRELGSLGNEVFFSADDGVHGVELWKTDGSAVGTTLVEDISPPDSDPQELAPIGNQIIFVADDRTHGREIWATDGTAEGTQLLVDISLGPGGSDPYQLTPFRGGVFFVAGDSTSGPGLWMTDGTQAGTTKFADIARTTGYFDGGVSEVEVVGDTMFVAIGDGVYGYELWVTDGTEAGTRIVKDIYPGEGSSYPAELTNFMGQLYFAARDPIHGSELWKTDGTEAGTLLVKDINPGSDDGVENDPEEVSFNVVGETLLLSANDGVHGEELWRSDGTEAGTTLVKDIFRGSDDGIDVESALEFATLAGNLFFVADDGVHGLELWKSDGSESGTVIVEDIVSGPESSMDDYDNMIVAHNGFVFFVANDGTHGPEWWRTDGTGTGTTLLKDINPGAGRGVDSEELVGERAFVQTGSEIYFNARNDEYGEELWRTDGTADGTRRISDIAPLTGDADISYLALAGDDLYFAADDGVHGTELWRLAGVATSVDESELFSASVLLSSTYPNPFNESLQFSITVGETQVVRVDLFDILGRKVAQVHDGVVAAQRVQQIRVEGYGLSSGLYFVRVAGNDFVKSIPIVLAK